MVLGRWPYASTHTITGCKKPLTPHASPRPLRTARSPRSRPRVLALARLPTIEDSSPRVYSTARTLAKKQAGIGTSGSSAYRERAQPLRMTTLHQTCIQTTVSQQPTLVRGKIWTACGICGLPPSARSPQHMSTDSNSPGSAIFLVCLKSNTMQHDNSRRPSYQVEPMRYECHGTCRGTALICTSKHLTKQPHAKTPRIIPSGCAC